MLPGPVFTFELMKTARRGRLYLVRAFYAGLLLVILWTVHSGWVSDTGGELKFWQVKFFALSAFLGIAIGQAILALALTPALVAGVIADEKERKTLHYLMASQLTNAEIVLGKLLVRMLYLVVLLGVSVPVLSLLVLMGGIDPKLVVLVCAATFSTAWFLATLSIWVSTIVRRVRDAFFVAYALEGLWLLSPLILRGFTFRGWPVVDLVADWLVDWVAASSPVGISRDIAIGMALGGGSVTSSLDSIVWMMVLQTAFGLVLAILASIQLRPIFRRQQGDPGIPTRSGPVGILMRPRRWRLRRRPALADQPMLWKELHTDRPRGFVRFVGFVLTLIVVGYLLYAAVSTAAPAIREMWEHGYAPPTSLDAYARGRRWQFYWFVRGVAPLFYMFATLAIAATAAAAITSEHEGDTWVSLTSTDLTGREILFAKLTGALKRGQSLATVILVLALAGVVAGAIHILSLPALILALTIYGWFAAALGAWISLQLRSTWRAQFLTVAGLILLNISGQGILNALSSSGFAPQAWPGFTPYEISKLLLDPHIIRHLTEAPWPTIWRIRLVDDSFAWLAIFSLESLLVYASLASLLTWHALRRFDAVAGRARRRTRIREAKPGRE
jgi:ABC-type transport system involved in multi-copper enzyme maturation permease subunit